MATVDLNIDLGELPREPAELFGLATVVNVACGGHAGDTASMARAVSFAMTRGARLAAHPSYPDREGFGRGTMPMASGGARGVGGGAVRGLQAVARKLGYPASTMKPHGALYHDASRDPALAAAVIEGAARGLAISPADLTVVGPPRGALLEEALRRGARYAREGFADRAYQADGTLVPRSEPGALVTDPAACARQALRAGGRGQRGDALRARRHGRRRRHRRPRARRARPGGPPRGRGLSPIRVLSYGEGAAFVDLGAASAPDRAARTLATAAALRAALPAADVGVAAGTLVVVGAPVADVRRALAAPPPAIAGGPPRSHTLAVVYDGPISTTLPGRSA